jgi:hypothetical protein
MVKQSLLALLLVTAGRKQLRHQLTGELAIGNNGLQTAAVN